MAVAHLIGKMGCTVESTTLKALQLGNENFSNGLDCWVLHIPNWRQGGLFHLGEENSCRGLECCHKIQSEYAISQSTIKALREDQKTINPSIASEFNCMCSVEEPK